MDAQQEKKQRQRPSWRRVAAMLLFTICALYLGMWLISQFTLWKEAKEVAVFNPAEALTPVALTDTSIASIDSGTRIDRFGYSFQIPSEKVKLSHDYKGMTMFKFEDGLFLLIDEPSGYMDFLSPLDKSKPQERLQASTELADLIGPEAVRSHYDYTLTELNARPSEISLFHSRRTNARVLVLLTGKSMAMQQGTTAIYRISTANFRGFQFGDPHLAPTSIELLLFDAHDQPLKLLLKASKEGRQLLLTQPQINAIIASIHPTTQ